MVICKACNQGILIRHSQKEVSGKGQEKSGVLGKDRRSFVKKAAGAGVFQIVAPHVLGGPRYTPPSETFGAALIGAGGRGPGKRGSGGEGMALG